MIEEIRRLATLVQGQRTLAGAEATQTLPGPFDIVAACMSAAMCGAR